MSFIYVKENKYPKREPRGTPTFIGTQPEFMYFFKFIVLMPITKKTFKNFKKIASYSKTFYFEE